MANFRMAMIAVAAATAITGSQALAADASSALAPGKPAGVYEAQHHRTPLLLIGAGVVVVVAAVVVATASSNNPSCSATACPTATPATST